MFVDSIKLKLTAGRGGNGIVAWRREKFLPKGGPYGGNGGNGGSILLKSDSNLSSLESFCHKRIICAENGKEGGSKNCHGRNGKDLLLPVPCGTLVKESTTNAILYDFTKEGEEYLLCEGGRGGRGNSSFTTPTNRAPNRCTLGKPGESKIVELELKLIADVGFVGLPNAGKSTLLSKLSNSPIKIGAYPFTTLVPNIRTIECDDFSRITIADIPGIIKNAHKNRGLGFSFLKHIERSSILVYLIDIGDNEKQNPMEDLYILRNEISAYSSKITKKPFLVALNKIDQKGAKKKIAEFQKKTALDPRSLFFLSAKEGTGLLPFFQKIKSLLSTMKKPVFNP